MRVQIRYFNYRTAIVFCVHTEIPQTRHNIDFPKNATNLERESSFLPSSSEATEDNGEMASFRIQSLNWMGVWQRGRCRLILITLLHAILFPYFLLVGLESYAGLSVLHHRSHDNNCAKLKFGLTCIYWIISRMILAVGRCKPVIEAENRLQAKNSE